MAQIYLFMASKYSWFNAQRTCMVQIISSIALNLQQLFLKLATLRDELEMTRNKKHQYYFINSSNLSTNIEVINYWVHKTVTALFKLQKVITNNNTSYYIYFLNILTFFFLPVTLLGILNIRRNFKKSNSTSFDKLTKNFIKQVKLFIFN